MRPEKKYLVDELTEKIKRSNGLYLTSFIGINAEDLSELRTKCRNQSNDYLVVKNRIFKIALKNAGFDVTEEIDKKLKGSTAVAFSKEDDIALAKLLINFGKDKSLPELKGGIVDGNWFDENQVVELSKLPSREVLYAQFMGTLKAPLNGMVSVLIGPIRNFVYALNAIVGKKQS